VYNIVCYRVRVYVYMLFLSPAGARYRLARLRSRLLHHGHRLTGYVYLTVPAAHDVVFTRFVYISYLCAVPPADARYRVRVYLYRVYLSPAHGIAGADRPETRDVWLLRSSLGTALDRVNEFEASAKAKKKAKAQRNIRFVYILYLCSVPCLRAGRLCLHSRRGSRGALRRRRHQLIQVSRAAATSSASAFAARFPRRRQLASAAGAFFCRLRVLPAASAAPTALDFLSRGAAGRLPLSSSSSSASSWILLWRCPAATASASCLVRSSSSRTTRHSAACRRCLHVTAHPYVHASPCRLLYDGRAMPPGSLHPLMQGCATSMPCVSGCSRLLAWTTNGWPRSPLARATGMRAVAPPFSRGIMSFWVTPPLAVVFSRPSGLLQLLRVYFLRYRRFRPGRLES
jgi:hypothetical protein